MSENNSLFNQKADQCVKCGLCLPHCPTYRLFQDENESPRGRIALMQALANDQFPLSDRLQQHLDHCLACRNCERLCPSGVDYGYLLDHARQRLHKQAPLMGLGLAYNKTAQRMMQTLLSWYQRTGLQALLRHGGILRLLRLRHLDRLIPVIPPYQRLQPSYPATGIGRAVVGLFTGCTGQLFDQATLLNSIRLLQGLGYEVVIPSRQTCCGALHQHQGQLAKARQLARQNIHAFERLDTIIYIASGCGAQLHDYDGLFESEADSKQQAEVFRNKIQEITAFLAGEDLSGFSFQPLHKKVLIHTPCSMRNNLRKTDETLGLLSHIPGLQLESIPAETGCCGAAGSYMLTQPGLADEIRQNSVRVIEHGHADIVTSINVGCCLHLSAGLPDDIMVSHPVNLLARQINALQAG